MHRVRLIARSFMLTFAAVAVTGLFPAAGYATEELLTPPAEAAPATTSETTTSSPPAESSPAPVETATIAPPPPPPVTTTGPQQPTGADSKNYTYNEATGLWENDYYSWDPLTKKTTPKTSPSYSYNPATGMWDTEQWRYNAATGKYEPNIVSVARLPAGQEGQAEQLAIAGHPADGSLINDSDSSQLFFTGFYDAGISNRIVSRAISGDALVSRNTLAGSALSGDALVISNLFNLLQSSTNIGAGGMASFMYDINGDVIGDLYIDPTIFAQLQAANVPPSAADSSAKIDIESNAKIANGVDLAALSGNATVAENTAAGNAATGTANAVANVVNMINSLIAANQSFMGVININGNFQGDILMPPGQLTELLASNFPSTTLSLEGDSRLLADLASNQNITNNVSLAALSGNATVAENTAAGNAATGKATTNLTVFNMTGRQVVGSNALLVFVNVLGEWVGIIVDAPAGSTAAALGGGVTACGGCGSAEKTSYDVSGNSAIVNDIDVKAISGDAEVSRNTSAGDAASGDASASANILNLINDSFSLSNWFGLLFINVFGSWYGSFGVDTAWGDPVAMPSPSPSSAGGAATTTAQVFKFVPKEKGGYRLSKVPSGFGGDREVFARPVSAVLASSHGGGSNTPPAGISDATASRSKGFSWFFPSLGLAVGLGLLGVERLWAYAQNRRQVL